MHMSAGQTSPLKLPPSLWTCCHCLTVERLILLQVLHFHDPRIVNPDVRDELLLAIYKLLQSAVSIKLMYRNFCYELSNLSYPLSNCFNRKIAVLHVLPSAHMLQ